MLASYICIPSLDNSVFEKVCNHFNYNDVPLYDSIYGSGAKAGLPKDEILYEYVAKKLIAMESLKQTILKEIEENDQLDLLNNIEIPLASVLAKMEVAGMKIDLAELESQKILYEDEIKELESKIYELAGITFNIQSPKQLGEVLFERLMLPVIKKSKSGAYTTYIEVLSRLVDEHEIINYIIRYRTVVKLYQTYLVGLEQQVHSDGKVHTIFQQALTTTGRLSSIEPNVQNIPIRTFEGRKIRKLFVPADDNLLFSSDYSQIELRVLAHMASSPLLIEAFKNNLDVHSETAKKIFATNEVTSDLRRKAKAVNFGIIYGISAYGLSNDVEISMKEAKEFIDKYFELYPEIKTFMDSTIEFASEAGYVLTLSNRRRYIPLLKSNVYMQKEAAKRVAMNAPIQGSAADIIKVAMINIDREITERKLKSKMVFQVHDELVFEVTPDEVDIIEELVVEEMKYAFRLSVPLDVSYGFGTNWMEIK
jgi:DNA polymerase-1